MRVHSRPKRVFQKRQANWPSKGETIWAANEREFTRIRQCDSRSSAGPPHHAQNSKLQGQGPLARLPSTIFIRVENSASENRATDACKSPGTIHPSTLSNRSIASSSCCSSGSRYKMPPKRSSEGALSRRPLGRHFVPRAG